MRRGRFLASLEEKVTITGSRPNSIPDSYEKTDQSIIILEDFKPRLNQKGFVEQELRYLGNIVPPNFDIQINDLVTRQPRDSDSPRGSSNKQLQTLTVENIQVVYGKQQLQLQDLDGYVR